MHILQKCIQNTRDLSDQDIQINLDSCANNVIANMNLDSCAIHIIAHINSDSCANNATAFHMPTELTNNAPSTRTLNALTFSNLHITLR